MRIICEECKAVYCIADKVIGAMGRIVKCAKCYHTWMVSPKHEGLRAQSNNNIEKINLPVLFKPALPKYFKIIPISLFTIIIFITLIFFSNYFIKIPLFSYLYEKYNIYDTEDLLLHSFIFDIDGDDIIINGVISNNSNKDKFLSDIRYQLLNKDKEIIFRYNQKLPCNKAIKPKEEIKISSKIINVKENAEYLELDIGNKLEILLR